MTPRRRQPSMTEADLWTNGLPIRLAVLSELTGRSRAALVTDIERGDLKAFQYLKKPGSAWYVHRVDARAWLQSIRHHAC